MGVQGPLAGGAESVPAVWRGLTAPCHVVAAPGQADQGRNFDCAHILHISKPLPDPEGKGTGGKGLEVKSRNDLPFWGARKGHFPPVLGDLAQPVGYSLSPQSELWEGRACVQ